VGAVALAVLLPLPDPAPVIALFACAVLLGLELQVDRQSPVPALLVVVVVAAAVVTGTDGGLLAAMVVGIAGTGAAWTLARPRRWALAATACLVVSVAAIAAAALYAWLGGGPSSVAVGVLAATTFEAVVIGLGPHRRLQRSALAVWSAPVVVGAVALARLWRTAAWASAGVFALGLGLLLVAVAWSAAPPWRSRLLGRWAGRRHGSRRAVVLGVAAGSLSAAIVAVAVDGSARAAAVLVAVTLGATATAMTVAGVRQWRFAPRRRARACVVLMLVTAVIAFAYPPLGFAGNPVSIVIIGVSLLITARSAWRLVGFAPQRVPESWSASL
jgi:hypothetical protein